MTIRLIRCSMVMQLEGKKTRSKKTFALRTGASNFFSLLFSPHFNAIQDSTRPSLQIMKLHNNNQIKFKVIGGCASLAAIIYASGVCFFFCTTNSFEIKFQSSCFVILDKKRRGGNCNESTSRRLQLSSSTRLGLRVENLFR